MADLVVPDESVPAEVASAGETPRRRVLVMGSGGTLSAERERVARAVGAALSREGYDLVTGSWGGVDNTVAEAFTEWLEWDEVKERLTHLHGVGRPQPDTRGRLVPLAGGEKGTGEALAQADVLVLIGGGKWSDMLLQTAWKRHKPVLALGSTGGTAQRVLDAQLSGLQPLPPGITPTTLEALRASASTEAEADGLAKRLLELLERVFTTRAARAAHRVLVKGSSEPRSEETRLVAQAVGKALAAEGYGLLTLGLKGVETEVLQAFQNTLWEQGVPPEQRITEVSRPGDREVAPAESYRDGVARADALVLISGGRSTQLFASLGEELHKPVFPVPVKGTNASAEALTRIQALWNEQPFTGIDRKLFDELRMAVSSSVDAEEVARVLIRLLDQWVTAREATEEVAEEAVPEAPPPAEYEEQPPAEEEAAGLEEHAPPAESLAAGPVDLQEAERLLEEGRRLRREPPEGQEPDYRRAGECFEQAFRIYRQLYQREGMAESLWWLGDTRLAVGSWPTARHWFEECSGVARETSPATWLAPALHQLGVIDRLEGRLDDSSAHLNEALRAADAEPDRHWQASVRYELGRTALEANQWDEAERWFHESRRRWRPEDQEGNAATLSQLAWIARLREDREQAERLAEDSLILWDRVGLSHIRFLALVRSMLTEFKAGIPGAAEARWDWAGRELRQLDAPLSRAGQPLLDAFPPGTKQARSAEEIAALADESARLFQQADDLGGVAAAVLVWAHAEELAASLEPVVTPPPAKSAEGKPEWRPTGKRVLVAGNGDVNLPEVVNWTAREVGRMLAAEGHSLVTGGWHGVDYVTAEEYARVLAERGASLEEHLTQVRSERAKPAEFPGGTQIFAGPGEKDIDRSVELADAVVLVGGNGGAFWPFTWAQNAGKPIFPFASTEGDALDAYREQTYTWRSSDYPGLSLEQFRELERPIRSREEAAEVVAALASMLRTVLGLEERAAPAEPVPAEIPVVPTAEGTREPSEVVAEPEDKVPEPVSGGPREEAAFVPLEGGGSGSEEAAGGRLPVEVSVPATRGGSPFGGGTGVGQAGQGAAVAREKPEPETPGTDATVVVRRVVEGQAEPPGPRERALRVEVSRELVKVRYDGKVYQGRNRLNHRELLQAQVDPRRYGEALFTALFHDEVPREWDRNLTTLAGFQDAVTGPRPLRIELELDPHGTEAEQPVLRSYRWEYLRQPGEAPLAMLEQVPLFRIQQDRPVAPVTAKPLRVLVVLCAPLDLEAPHDPLVPKLAPLNLELEREIIAEAFQRLEAAGLAECRVLDGRNGRVTRAALRAALQEGVHALHLVAHGFFSPELKEYGVVMEDEKRLACLEELSRFDAAFFPETLKLVVLAACQGAGRQEGAARLGLGPHLTGLGVPAVVSMQDNIPIADAQFFTQRFYDDLARTGRVDAAMAATRYDLYSEAEKDRPIRRSWGIPVLVLTTSNGRLFEVDRGRAAELPRFEAHIRPPEELPGEDPDLESLARVVAAKTGTAADLSAVVEALRALQVAPPPPAIDPDEAQAPPQDRVSLTTELELAVRISARELQAFVEAGGDGRPGLRLDPAVYRQVAAALNAGKHLIFIGPPGTAKTTLAQAVARFAQQQRFARGLTPATATADWTTFDTVGGYAPNRQGTLQFRPGLFLRALSEGHWLVIDEINRAEIDKAFGELFTVLSGQQVDLPYFVGGRGVRILPPARKNGWLPAESPRHHDYVLHPAWRILATMNAYDKSYLFAMSFAFMRRFAFIDVALPDVRGYGALVAAWLKEKELDTGEGLEQLGEMLNHLLHRDSELMGRRALGPAIVRDVVAYIRECRDQNGAGPVPAIELLAEAYLLYGVSQLDGLDADGIGPIFHELGRFLAKYECGEVNRNLVLDRIRLLYPHLSADVWNPENAPPPKELVWPDALAVPEDDD